MIALFRNRVYAAVVLCHLCIDILNSTGPVLLAVLAPTLRLSNAQIGLALTLYTFTTSLSQPGFGWLTDRVRSRPAALAGVGVAWTALWFCGLAFATSWPVLLGCFLLAAIGSGLFHPIGTATAAIASPERGGMATSVFFFGGQIGIALGPVLGGLLYRTSGNFGVLPLALLALFPALLIMFSPAPVATVTHVGGGGRAALRASALAIGAFVLLVAMRSSIQAAYSSFLPKLFADRGWDPAAYGLLAGTFMFAAAIGNLIAGDLADRRGMRMATVLPLLLGVPTGLVCLWAPTPMTAFVGSALTGLFVGGQHSVLVLHAQRLLPMGRGLAAGLILGFTFASGGVGVWLSGIAADQVGLLPVMQIVTLLGLPAALLAMTLPGRAPIEQRSVARA